MKVLVLNCGSSSIKYQLFNMDDESVIAKGGCDRIGLPNSTFKYKAGDFDFKLVVDLPTHKEGVNMVLEYLLDKEHGVIKSLDEISAIGHRYVHGGQFVHSVLVDDEVMDVLKDNIDLAPLHCPAHITGINACKAIAPNIPNIAVFDTAFHSTMPDYAYLYPIPKKYYEDLKIRKYGFHGTSHKYVSQVMDEILGEEYKEKRLITCHIGNGASLAAIKDGKVLDTTMGFTPLAGVAMGTRSGDIDPSIIAYICKKTNTSVEEVTRILNKESGLLGISGFSSDSRDICENMNTNPDAKLANDIMCYTITKHMGAFSAVLHGVDAIVWTAGIGENSCEVREGVMKNFEYLGVEFDYEKNRNLERGVIAEISKPTSKVKVYVIPTNEELVIAREALEIANKN